MVGLVALALILILARGMGELARRIEQPEVVGELFAGLLLGPSVLGALAPGLFRTLFLDPGAGLLLSGLSWIGAVLLLFVSGMEADLDVLRADAKAGLLAASFAIVLSIAAGVLFARLALGRPLPYAFFLGIVLSVTAVSVAGKILIEREVLRRRYAQVILAAGVLSEVVVWLLVAVVSSAHGESPILVAAQRAAYAISFFLFVLLAGPRFTAWAMRRVTDQTRIVRGQLSLSLVLLFLSAALTQALALHALLGAFVFGLLLRRAPRTNRRLVDGLQALTTALFAPIFFALAGMRVDIQQLHSAQALELVFLLLMVATLVKAGCGTLGAWLGGLHAWEAALVGVGVNLKGGTDIIVAIVGVQLGLFAVQTYTMYAVVAILTVFFSPLLLTLLERRVPVRPEEAERLGREEAERRSYLPRVQRVLVPILPELRPLLAADLVQHLARSKHDQGQIFDVTQLAGNGPDPLDRLAASEMEDQAADVLRMIGTLKNVELTRRRVANLDTLKALLDATQGHDLIAIGASPIRSSSRLTFGDPQDRIICQARADILVAVAEPERLDWSRLQRILVPLNGMEYSLAAGDVAAHLAQASNAELVLLHVAESDTDPLFWREMDHRHLRKYAFRLMEESAFRVGRLGVRVTQRALVGEEPGRVILEELRGASYQLVVLGGLERGIELHPILGRTIRTVLTRSRIPAVVVVSHSAP